MATKSSNPEQSLTQPWPAPVKLTGQVVAVEPLTQTHADDLGEAAIEGAQHLIWYTAIPAPEHVSTEIDRRLALQATGTMLPFAIIDHSGGATHRRAVGMTTYMNIDAPNRRLEIGSTWYRKSVQRSGLNTECKFLLLRHAFETLGCNAVEFRTHFMNHQSRRAIERLGAKLDGILRSHTIMPNGSLRDTCVYSIVAHEWPMIQSHLNWQMQKPRD